jgi:anti-sigma regulatory factor (Ser/Thr protein kinase)
MIRPAPARRWTLPGVPESVRTFRSLARAESATAYQAEAAALCVSELVTNAIEHTWSGWPGGVITVTFCASRSLGELLITVTDDGSMGPATGPWLWPGPETGRPAESGRGLSIVDALAAGDWGRCTAPPRGWSVWCSLVRHPDDLNLRTTADLGGPDRSPEAEAPAETRLH